MSQSYATLPRCLAAQEIWIFFISSFKFHFLKIILCRSACKGPENWIAVWLQREGIKDPNHTLSFSPPSPPICCLPSCNHGTVLHFFSSFLLPLDRRLVLCCVRSHILPLLLLLHSVLKLSIFPVFCYHTSLPGSLLPLTDPLLFITINNTRRLLPLKLLPLFPAVGRDPWPQPQALTVKKINQCVSPNVHRLRMCPLLCTALLFLLPLCACAGEERQGRWTQRSA